MIDVNVTSLPPAYCTRSCPLCDVNAAARLIDLTVYMYVPAPAGLLEQQQLLWLESAELHMRMYMCAAVFAKFTIIGVINHTYQCIKIGFLAVLLFASVCWSKFLRL